MSQYMENEDMHWSQQGYKEQGEKIKPTYPNVSRRGLTLAIVSITLVLLFSCPTLIFVIPAFSGANGLLVVIISAFVLTAVLLTILIINYLYYKRH